MTDIEKKLFRHQFCLLLITITLINHARGQTTLGSLSAVNGVTMHLCPLLCTIGDQWSCVPPPCPFPPCVDPAKYKSTDCCSYCPNGRFSRFSQSSFSFIEWESSGSACTKHSFRRSCMCWSLTYFLVLIQNELRVICD